MSGEAADHAVPRSVRLGLAVLLVLEHLDLVVELERLGDERRQLDAVALEAIVARQDRPVVRLLLDEQVRLVLTEQKSRKA